MDPSVVAGLALCSRSLQRCVLAMLKFGAGGQSADGHASHATSSPAMLETTPAYLCPKVDTDMFRKVEAELRKLGWVSTPTNACTPPVVRRVKEEHDHRHILACTGCQTLRAVLCSVPCIS
eukprot:5074622-Amphidinium_carterae.1